MSTITITYGEVCENHVGMQKVGSEGEEGLEFYNLKKAQIYFEKKGYKCQIIYLNNLLPEGIESEDAWILIVRNGANALGDADKFLKEQESLDWDTKAKMWGKVVNKRARWNLCYAPTAQDPNYPAGKGRIVAFEDVPELETIRGKLQECFGDKAKDLYAEGNLYYDVDTCFIGWHGDGERKIVIAIRLGADMPLYYQWYLRSKPISEKLTISLNHGDLYAMSTKATGNDWLRKTIPTLRHAAGKVKTKSIKKLPETREEELYAMKMVDLKALLKEKKLKISGKKALLVARLLEYESDK